MRKTSRWILNRFLFGLVSLPLAIAAVPAALTGGAESAARRQVRNARRLTSAPLDVRPTGPGRVVAHTLAAFLPALISLLAALMMVYLVGAAFLYPLRPDTISTIGHPLTHDHALDGSWGGTTLIGAWLAHSIIGFGLELGSLLILWATSTAQLKLTRRLLAVARPAPIAGPAPVAGSVAGSVTAGSVAAGSPVAPAVPAAAPPGGPAGPAPVAPVAAAPKVSHRAGSR